MAVVNFRRKLILGDSYLQSDEIVSDTSKFLLGAAVTLLGPTILYCIVIGELWPLYLIACNDALGVILGVAMFKKSPEPFVACVPQSQVPFPIYSRLVNLKKAA